MGSNPYFLGLAVDSSVKIQNTQQKQLFTSGGNKSISAVNPNPCTRNSFPRESQHQHPTQQRHICKYRYDTIDRVDACSFWMLLFHTSLVQVTQTVWTSSALLPPAHIYIPGTRSTIRRVYASYCFVSSPLSSSQAFCNRQRVEQAGVRNSQDRRMA